MSDAPKHEQQAPAGHADQQLFEAQQKIKARAPILIAVTAGILLVGFTVIIAGIALLLIAAQ